MTHVDACLAKKEIFRMLKPKKPHKKTNVDTITIGFIKIYREYCKKRLILCSCCDKIKRRSLVGKAATITGEDGLWGPLPE